MEYRFMQWMGMKNGFEEIETYGEIVYELSYNKKL